MKLFYKKYLIYLYLILVIILTIVFLNCYLKKVSPKINEVAEEKIGKYTNDIVTNYLVNNITKDLELNNLLIIKTNKNGEILTIDYNLNKAYQINNKIINDVKESLANFENDEVTKTKLGFRMDVPLLISSDYTIISNLGPKIPIKIVFVGSLYSNIHTKITNYGLNNALSQVYVHLVINELIISPVSEKKIKNEFDILIASVMINGRVPSLYGENYTTDTNILDIPME